MNDYLIQMTVSSRGEYGRLTKAIRATNSWVAFKLVLDEVKDMGFDEIYKIEVLDDKELFEEMLVRSKSDDSY